ncbi:MAG: hypothetical protein A2W35_01445 [Chloroflexi bacterium RBG_16_57_11]|nr:MAG: hypothetical protein A2W35_01445 [Chloroflexi bacterium RBG_16_57_11]
MKNCRSGNPSLVSLLAVTIIAAMLISACSLFRPKPTSTAVPLATELSSTAGPATPTNTQGPVQPTPYNCPDLALVRLSIGVNAQVAAAKLNLRSTPRVPSDYGANIVKELSKGDRLVIISGPECSHDGTWWQVQTETGETGWAREALADQRLVILAGATEETESTLTPATP